jgi:hypothetical protein
MGDALRAGRFAGLDGDDLLAPLLGGARWSIARDTYVTPGFRLTASLGMSL